MAGALNSLLKSVSRSFYLSLRVLPAALRPAMGTAYLLCRAADTVADTTLLPADRRLGLIGDIRTVFSVFPLPEEPVRRLAATLKEELAGDPSPERVLISRLDECLDAFRALSNTDRALTQKVVTAVATGMEMDLQHFGADSENLTAFETSDQLECYIGWIGGDPGRFWTEVCAAHGMKFKTDLTRMRDLGFHFGTGLQMVNILRDLPADLKMGRCYIPLDRLMAHGLAPEDLRSGKAEDRFRTLYHELIDETVDRLTSGLHYVENLSRMAIPARAAVWWPLALGLRTLGMLRGARSILEATAPVKVQRREVYWLMGTSLAELPFDGLLRADFTDLAEPARSAAGFH